MSGKFKIVLCIQVLMIFYAHVAMAFGPEERPGRIHEEFMAQAEGDGPTERGMESYPGPERAPSRERIEQIRKRVEMIKMWRLTEELGLDEKTAARLFPLLSKFDKKRMEFQRELFEHRRSIRQMETDGDEGVDYGALLEKVEKAIAAIQDLEEQQRTELKKILTPEEMLKYMAFEERFRREMQQMMRESRGRGRGGTAKKAPGGWGGMDGPSDGDPGIDSPDYQQK